MPDDLGGVGAPGDVRREGGRVDDDLFVEGGALVGRERPPVVEGLLPGRPAGRVGAALEVGEGGVVGRDHPGAGARLDAHVAHRHPPLHREARIAAPRYSMTWPMPPPVPMRPMIAEDDVLGASPRPAASPSTVDGHRRGPDLGEGLGGEHVLDLARADAEGQGAEGAVGGGVAVAADDRHARLGEPLLGADDVHDALVVRGPSGSR